MEMENEQVQPSYWNSIFIASLITAFIVSAASIIGGYMTLGTEPTGSFFNSAQLFSTIGCLLGAVGGVFANWHYAKEYNVTYKIGKGALIGLLVALVATVIAVLLGQLWNLLDPSFMESLVEWNIQNTEAMQIPEEAKQQTIDGFGDPNSVTNIAIQAGVTFISLAILNVISGLIGAKIFASEE